MADRNGHSASGTDKIRMNECQIAWKVVDIARSRRCGGRGVIWLIVFNSATVQIRNIKSRSVNSSVIFAPIADKCVGGGVFVRADKDKTVVRCRIFIPFFSGAGYVIWQICLVCDGALVVVKRLRIHRAVVPGGILRGTFGRFINKNAFGLRVCWEYASSLAHNKTCVCYNIGGWKSGKC